MGRIGVTIVDISRFRWLLAAVLLVGCTLGIVGLRSCYSPPIDQPVATPEPVVDTEPTPGDVALALSLYEQGELEQAADELLRVLHAESIVETVEAPAAMVDILVELGREQDLDFLVAAAIRAPINDIILHVQGLEELAARLYHYNDLVRASAVEEKLRLLVTEMVDTYPDDLMLRLYQVRLWAGYVCNFPEWQMVSWFVRALEQYLVTDEFLPDVARAELYGYQAQAMMDRWEGRDFEQASRALAQSRELYAENGWVWYLSGLMEMEYGDADLAIEALNQADRLVPEASEVKRTIALGIPEWRPVQLRHLFDTDGAEFDLSPDGTRLVVVDGDRIIVWDVVSGLVMSIHNTPGATGYPRWSRDGNQLAWLQGSGAGDHTEPVLTELVLLDLDTDTVHRLSDGSEFVRMEGVVWDHDGRVSAWVEPVEGQPGVYVWSDAQFTLIWPKDTVWQEQGADWDWSPDGRLAVLDAKPGYPFTNARIWLSGDASGSPLGVHDNYRSWHPGTVVWSSAGELLAHWAEDSWSTTPVKLVVVTGDGIEHITAGRSMEGGFTWAPDGDRLAYFSRPVASDEWQLVITDRDRTWEHRLSGNWRWWLPPVWTAADVIAAGVEGGIVAVFALDPVP